MEQIVTFDANIMCSEQEVDTICSSIQSSNITTRNTNQDIWYFGYGPIVNPLVRRRREISIVETRAAILPDHRLTFAYGGVVNVVPQRGFEVHGVIMKLENKEAWEKLQKFDSGTYVPQILPVYCYPTVSSCSDEEQVFMPIGAEEDSGDAIPARVFIMTDFHSADLEKPIERKPQERYLKLVAEGMRQEGVDEDYIQDFIMACPYVPYKKEEEWSTFDSRSQNLPKLSIAKYKKMCASSSRKKAASHDIFFVLNGNVVHKLGPHEDGNPLALWTSNSAHGNLDITLLLHKMIVDPRIPMVDTQNELTEQHYKWAENHMFEVLQQSGLTAQKVFVLVDESIRRSWRRPFSSIATRD